MEEESLILDIMKNAEAEAIDIISKAHEEVKYFILQNNKEIHKEEDNRRKEIKREIEQQNNNNLEMAELQARNKILAQKQKAILEVKQEITNKILNSTSKEYVSMITKMLENAKIENTSEYEIILPERERQQIEEVAKRNGFKISDEKADFRAGFILKKGRVEQNYVLDTWLEINKEYIDQVISEILFKKN